MLTQHATAEMMKPLRELWHAGFDDWERYEDLVFGALLRPDSVLAIPDEDGKPLAMLCVERTRVALGGLEPVRGAYLYGVATDPAHRGRGLSTRLLEETHRLLEEEGMALSMLVPGSEALFGFYRKRGYETGFSYRRIDLERGEIPNGPGAEPAGVLAPVRLEQLEEMRGKFFAGSSLFAAWGRDWLRFTGAECRLLGGEVLRYSRAGRDGYAVCYPHGERLLVKELAVAPDELGGLLRALRARYRKARYELRVPADFSSSFGGAVLPFGMVKWYDKKTEQKTDGSGGRSPWLAFVLD